LTPFLKAAGGKRQLLPELLARLPSSWGRYHEPFVGGGALFWELQSTGRLLGGATLSDANPHLVAAWIGVRDQIDLVVDLLRKLPDDEETFRSIREQDTLAPLLEGPPGADLELKVGHVTWLAARFLYLNRTCFNGLYRVNRAGRFNVPYDASRRGKRDVVREDVLRAASAGLHGVFVARADFEVALSDARPGDLAYLDSPYVPVSKTSNFTGYTEGGFKAEDQVRLRDRALELRRRGVHVVLSNADCETVRELYADFRIERVEARRNINSRGDRRGSVGEVIIT
jgi:DNA adenine methylase